MIECKDLTFKYGNNVIFKNLNLQFKDNTITSIMGPSGKGKTTLLRCIAGLNNPSSGFVVYEDSDFNPFDEENYETIITEPDSRIFMMHQHYSNFPWKNCLDNVLFPLKLNNEITKNDIEIAKQLLNEVGLTDYTKYPGELSGGMNQRLAFARTLIMKPKVLLMDEPMSALDEDTRKVMQELLLKMHKKTKNIIILVTHSLKEAQYLSDKIVNL